jgi:glucokinase
MRMGDATAKNVVDRYINYVACGIINIVNALQPEMICIGGGIANEGENLLEPIRRILERERYSIYAKKQTLIRKAELGNDAGVIGAALLDD